MLTDRTQESAARRKVWALAGFSLLLSLGLAAVTKGYSYDNSCFLAWAQRIAAQGTRGFYAEDYFCDYPPAYLLLLWLPGRLMALPLFQKAAAQRVLLAFVPALSGAALGPLCWRIGRKNGVSPQTALRLGAAAAFCPALLYNTGIWGQIDALFALLMLGCFLLLEEKRWLLGALCYGAALAVKPQALLTGPVLAVCFLWPLLFARARGARLAALKNSVLGAAAALAPMLLCGLPFWGAAGLWDGLAEKYFSTATSYPYASINACNGMSFLGGEWAPQDERIPFWGLSLPLSWRQLGIILLAALTVFLVVLAWRAQKAGRFSPMLLAAVYGTGVFALGHRMHERYLIFAAVLVLGAAARFGHRRLLALGYGLSLCCVLNMALVYHNVGTDDEFLTSAMSVYMLRAVGLCVVVLFGLLAHTAWKILIRGETDPFSADTGTEIGGAHPAEKGAAGPRCPRRGAAKTAASAAERPRPAWTKKEILVLLGLTAAVALTSFVYLGDLTAPQSLLDENGTSMETTVTVQGDAAELWIYPGISTDNSGSVTVLDADGAVMGTIQLSYGSVFSWQRMALYASSGYTLQISDGQIVEMAFRDADGRLLAVGGDAAGTALFDEQALVPDTISQLNSMYFDEIYHARTGYEMLHGMTVYETTHPPLGKDFILLGIAVFGMTGFGWRFSGTLFGVLLVPLLYCFVRRLTRSPKLGLFAAVLLSFDFMRFSQSRLATIDTYAVFFILLGADLMLWYCERVREAGVTKAVLPMALAGAAFGLGCASKWTGIYAGAGLAVLYFGALAGRWRILQAQPAPAGVQAPGESRLGLPRPARLQFRREACAAILGGVVFFVLVPLCIYWASYLPYWLRDSSFGFSDWWNCQTYMYWYHSTLEATHPFSSSWYSWLLDLRPVWYYKGSGLPAGEYASIAGFVNPVIALAGLVAWLQLARRQLVGEGSREGAAVIILLLSSLLPWVLVPRCTFLYHYFPCVPFLIAALALCLQRFARQDARAARRAAVLLAAAAAVLFLWFYPVLSGLPVGKAWAASMKWLASWGFYIL